MDVLPNLAKCICIPSDFCETLVTMGEIWAHMPVVQPSEF